MGLRERCWGKGYLGLDEGVCSALSDPGRNQVTGLSAEVISNGGLETGTLLGGWHPAGTVVLTCKGQTGSYQLA